MLIPGCETNAAPDPVARQSTEPGAFFVPGAFALPFGSLRDLLPGKRGVRQSIHFPAGPFQGAPRPVASRNRNRSFFVFQPSGSVRSARFS
jgi:hypothetical protein